MSKTPGPIGYPNRIEDHHTVVKMREMIDGHNSLQATTDEHAKTLADHGATIAALPNTYTTPAGVVNQIGMYVSTPTFLTGLNTALVKLGFTVPHPPQAVSGLKVRRLSGPRLEAPMDLGTQDAGLLYYCTDYARLVMWDGWAYQINDPGGYFVDSDLELGVGWAVCDGGTTDYMLNDSPSLEVRAYTTRRHRSLTRNVHRYFRR